VSQSGEPSIRQWTVAHDRSHPEWNEDASRAELAVAPDGWTAFLVVADGAGSTPFAGDWARALVEAARPEWVVDGFADGVEHVRRRFDPLRDGGRDVDFILEENWHELGSASTLLAAVVTSRRGTTRCRVTTVGDCLALVSEPGALASFPLRASAEFTNRPETIRTRRPELEIKSWTCDLPAGSALALATDAVAAWLLRLREREGAGSVHAWLRTLSERDLPDVDDDATLLVLDVPAAPVRPGRFNWLSRLVDRLRKSLPTRDPNARRVPE
jgi:hypothetical protein